MGLFDTLIRGAEASAPAVAAGMQGARLRREDQRKRQTEDAEREEQIRQDALRRMILQLDVDRERRQAQPKPNRYTYQGREFDTPEEVAAAKRVIEPETETRRNAQTFTDAKGQVWERGEQGWAPAPVAGGGEMRGRVPRDPDEPTASQSRLARNDERRMQLDQMRGHARMVLREYPGIGEHLIPNVQGHFPEADPNDVRAVVAEALGESDRSRLAAENTRSSMEQRERPDPRAALMAAIRGETAPDSMQAPRTPQGGKGTAVAQPAPVMPRAGRGVDPEMVRQLKAQGLTDDQIIARLRSQGLIH